jgi:hypothetical protein
VRADGAPASVARRGGFDGGIKRRNAVTGAEIRVTPPMPPQCEVLGMAKARCFAECYYLAKGTAPNAGDFMRSVGRSIATRVRPNRRNADAGCELLRVGRDCGHRLLRGFEQQMVDHGLVLVGDLAIHISGINRP